MSDQYLFAYFNGNGKDGVHLAYSYDGISWKALNQDRGFLKPDTGKAKLMRDPAIFPGPDGVFRMVWTVSWGERGIGYACSEDLIHWSDQEYIPVMEHEPGARNCWAPEMIYDDVRNQFMIFWATTIPGRYPETDGQSSSGLSADGNNHRMYYATTRDFQTFSETRLLFDQGFNVIDACIVKDEDRYLMFLKDETNLPFTPQKNIRLSVSKQPEGPYSPASAPITGDYWCEGPSAIKIGDTWFVYFDRYRDGRYGAVASKDLREWEDISDEVDFPAGTKHGTVFPVSSAVLERLLNL